MGELHSYFICSGMCLRHLSVNQVAGDFESLAKAFAVSVSSFTHQTRREEGRNSLLIALLHSHTSLPV